MLPDNYSTVLPTKSFYQIITNEINVISLCVEFQSYMGPEDPSIQYH